MKSNWLLQGDIGTGKTRALKTLLPTFLDENDRVQEGVGLDLVALISMEPGAEATLGRNFCGAADAHEHVIHHHFIPPVAVGFDIIADFIELANRVPTKTLLETTDPDKRHYKQAIELCSATADFVCDGCGASFGAIRDWPETHGVALDSLTGMTKAFTQNVVGGKPVLSLPEYNIIMNLMEAFIDAYWGNTKCWAGMIAHVDREVNPLTGQTNITVHTIGQKLAPRIVKKPDEVITAHFDPDSKTYYWSTEPEGVVAEVQKRRRLPYGSNLAPTFAQMVK